MPTLIPTDHDCSACLHLIKCNWRHDKQEAKITNQLVDQTDCAPRGAFTHDVVRELSVLEQFTTALNKMQHIVPPNAFATCNTTPVSNAVLNRKIGKSNFNHKKRATCVTNACNTDRFVNGCVTLVVARLLNDRQDRIGLDNVIATAPICENRQCVLINI